MGEPDHAAVGSHLRLLFEAGTVTGVSDGHLLEMFASRRDELAFTTLVERHGPMVRPSRTHPTARPSRSAATTVTRPR
jgi:hypothetical protein